MDKYQVRTFASDIKTREDADNPVIEGYFAVFNSEYDMGFDMYESISPGAFKNSLSGDIRALLNHDSNIVLGRTKAHTLELKEDSHGLWGKISINPKDTEAMNLYERVKRGDISQCSFGFSIVQEEADHRDDGSIHWTLKEVELFEVSPCTFPAYEETGISARKRDKAELFKRRNQAWREKMLKKLKGWNENGT